ncbi:MAG: hypothetical protein IT182_12850 [Acidobacteria bacterium]|nr:hypothetical protein [Acidobacteriota bacterium]
MIPHGANLPWLRYGGDFGANAWSPRGGLSVSDRTPLHRVLDTAASAGAEVVRWFVLCDGRAGFTVDASGMPTGLHPVVLDDMAIALDTLHAHGLRMVPVLFDFTWADVRRVVNGVALGGGAPVLRDPVARHTLWRAVDDLLVAFGRHPAIAMWDLWNEPEWMTTPWRPPARRLSSAQLRRCLAELALHVRWHAVHPITVGLASAAGLPLCRALDLDVLQVHWYDHLERRHPLARCPHVTWSHAPLLLGEYPTRGSATSPERIIDIARNAGYAATWPWSLHADDRCTDNDAALHALQHGRTQDEGSDRETGNGQPATGNR